MDILRKVWNYSVENSLFDTELLVVGVSGGPDSVALLSILSEFKNAGRLGCELIAVHVNHQLRQGDADKDEEFVLNLCDKLDIKCLVYSENINLMSSMKRQSVELVARDFRYRSFDDCCRKIKGDDYREKSRIAVAHHRNDLAETFMMNLYRGSGLDGLVAPLPLNGRIIRPLLVLSRSEIMDYLEKNSLDYRIDYTNNETDCTRNKWRNEIFPLISEVSVKPYESAVFETVELLRADAEYINKQAVEFFDSHIIRVKDCEFIKCTDLVLADKSISSRVLRMMFERAFENKVDFANKNVSDCLALCESEIQALRTIDMPGGRKLWTAAGYAGFCEERDLIKVQVRLTGYMGFVVSDEEFSSSFSVSEENKELKITKFTQLGIQIESQIIENSSAVGYNFLSWTFPLQNGDKTHSVTIRNGICKLKFTRTGQAHGKAVSDLLSDRKVPRGARDKVVGFFLDGELVFVPGLGACSKKYDDGLALLIRPEEVEDDS